MGASSGATPITSMSREMIADAVAPVYRSRMTAIAVVIAAALPTPWITRRARSGTMPAAKMHSTEVMTWMRTPTITGRRRP